MPFTITKTLTLRTRDIPPFKDSVTVDATVASSLDSIARAMRVHPAMRHRSVTIAGDGLTKTTTTIWDSQSAYIEFVAANKADLARVAAAASAYNQAHGIVVSTSTSGD